MIYTNAKDIEVGSVLADMHYGITSLDLGTPHEVVSSIQFPCEKGDELIRAILGRSVTNKFLVVVCEDNYKGNIVAMWSYDARTVGLVEIKLLRKGEWI